MRRRRFIAGVAGALVYPGLHSARAATTLRILVLGGTQFIGVHMTELALARGHHVTLFNRGKSNPALFPTVEKLRGDRDGQLDALRGRSWDAVIDDSGYVPRHVRLSAQLLAPEVRRYLYISSISAYASFAQPNNEDSALGHIDDPSIEKVSASTYGPLKALCERQVTDALPGRAIVLRPGIVVGPHDPTDRFTYWPARAARGGEMLAPGSASDPTQFIDARDLARFALDSIEHDRSGIFNMVTPPGRFSFGDLIASSAAAAQALARPAQPPRTVWVARQFLEQQGEGAEADGHDFPMWFPAVGEDAGFARVSSTRAQAAGLTITPLATTVHDTLAWHLQRPEAERSKLKVGLTPEREQQLLSAWRGQRAAG
jgi:2'-hydroxyisoflavone reductase